MGSVARNVFDGVRLDVFHGKRGNPRTATTPTRSGYVGIDCPARNGFTCSAWRILTSLDS